MPVLIQQQQCAIQPAAAPYLHGDPMEVNTTLDPKLCDYLVREQQRNISLIVALRQLDGVWNC